MNDATAYPADTPRPHHPRKWLSSLFFDVLLVLVLLIGGLLRFNSLQWGDNQYLHPDERFLVWVGSDIQPVGTAPETLGSPPNTIDNPYRAAFASALPDCQSWGGYFDASCSPLNPNNRGHNFYVYGTLPMFVTRYLVQGIYGHSGFNEMTVVGRVLSALVDLFSVVLVYAIASRLFSKPVGLLAAAFASFTVLNIQQSHFFTMDTFTSFFTLLAVYFAVRVSLSACEPVVLKAGAQANLELPTSEPQQAESLGARLRAIFSHRCFWFSIAFGLSLGCAVASKLSTAPVAFVLPLAFALAIWRKPASQRPQWLTNAVIYLAVAAFVSILVFRIFQPYAFLGPGFFGLRPNPMWLANIKELRDQASGDIDYPPSLQWARRPIWFSAQNMVAWGFGLPLGILAFLGFLWAGWRMLKGDWERHALLWLWGGFYFVWQSLQFNPTMRYQLPTYPMLAIFAAWALVELWHTKKRKGPESTPPQPSTFPWGRFASILVGGFVLVATFAWALAFSLVYSRPITRVAASEWIYQNIPGPITLHLQTDGGVFNQPLSIPYGSVIQQGYPYQMMFTSNASGTLGEVYLAHVADFQGTQSTLLNVSISTSGGTVALMTATMSISPTATGGFSLTLDTPLSVNAGQEYTLVLSPAQGDRALDACGPVTLALQTATELLAQPLEGPQDCIFRLEAPYVLSFMTSESAILEAISLSKLADLTPPSGPATLTLSIGPTGDSQQIATASLTADLAPGNDGRGAGYTLTLNRPVTLEKGKNYSLSLALESGGGVITFQGSAVANEGEWDDGLPLRVENYDAFGGIYTSGLNFNMYTDDNLAKLEHFIDVYDQSEYLLVSSNRQWGSLPRLPERFPMTSLHYRHLLGCPADRTIQWCYSVAEPGMFQGSLGFELVQVFQSDPSLGPLEINDQFAEEAFTVYDHPKVLIFRKTADYTSQKASEILNQANFSEMVRITPKKAAYHPANLKLTSVQWDAQTAGGTWSELFNPLSWQNRFPVLGVILWYLSVGLLGLLVYPLLRLALPGLPDHGYPLARIAGMLVLAYFTWLAGSLNIPFSRLTITLVILLMALVSAILAYRQRAELLLEWRAQRKYFLVVEGLLLAFFLVFLFVRLGNPDLWHPWKGGEKPMDFSYFNAVLKSTIFPPYDPWYAGGSMNYYYWGFVFVGVLVKWLGIVPSFAYNLILPTLFSLVCAGAFSLGYNLSHSATKDPPLPAEMDASMQAQPSPPSRTPYLIGLASMLGMALLGNLGTLRMIARGWQQLGIPGGLTDGTGFFARLLGTFAGLYQVLFQGAKMPYSIGDWYWIPSRAIPAPGDVEPITEFPLFTFLYGDLHAHMIALPIAMLALTWVVSVVLAKARWRSIAAGALGFLLGGLAIGVLYPINLSDIYTYLPLGMVALGYAIFRNTRLDCLSSLPQLSPVVKRFALAVGGVLVLVLLSYGLYLPYRMGYAQGYSAVIPWFGTHTPFWSYLTHWGLFLFVIISWMVWETRQWMAETPLASLRKLEKYTSLILLGLVILLLTCLLLSLKVPGIETVSLLNKLPVGRGAALAWFILPLAAWAGILLLRPGLPDARRLVLFWVGTGLLITLVVELVVVRGDIGRMNTVFKFYLQVWALFALSAAAALGWLVEPIQKWLPGWRITWRFVLSFLVFSAALFTLTASMAKIKDRWVESAPHTLDGMAFMPYATYTENYPNVTESTPVEQRSLTLDLAQDYRLIRWMQENIQGSPVIVEANSRNFYRWYSRVTIYTGLPGVVGWEWHQQQQRAVNPPEWVTRRIEDIGQFYNTVDTDITKAFLRLYDVRYIILGQLEQVTYPGPGLDKFAAFDGILWNEVYRDGSTILYEVIR